MASILGVNTFSNNTKTRYYTRSNNAQMSFSGNNNTDIENAKKQYEKHVKKRVFIDVLVGAAAVVGVWGLLDFFGRKVMDNPIVEAEAKAYQAQAAARNVIKNAPNIAKRI